MFSLGSHSQTHLELASTKCPECLVMVLHLINKTKSINYRVQQRTLVVTYLVDDWPRGRAGEEVLPVLVQGKEGAVWAKEDTAAP